MNAQTIQQNGQSSSNSTQNSEIMTNNDKIDEKVLGREKTPQKISEEIDENITNNKSIQSQIQEIRPDTIEKAIISDDLCKISFKIFTHDQNIEILYNPVRNMFNATKLIQFALNNINELKTSKNIDGISEKKKGGNFPPFDETEDLTSNNDDPKEILNSWFRNKDNIEFIDQISFQLTGKFHFMYNNKPIWNENVIIKDVLDFKGRVQLSLLSHNKDNILERIKGNTHNEQRRTDRPIREILSETQDHASMGYPVGTDR